ncbi:NAD(P)/FAD-dependent oxidoreductase [Aquifex aeolicus]|uniref:Sulfide dehydrogenase, flavoprotein subunit n=1 Tax=Aquifex aeolicus (strain VF5) TaxID=224324 RepID=O66600_AQUAE|nr:FAD/NAD(P)-binding oxidoreductase [Aquifex aeolicus]AAC06556.1 sulfide dehydrogenase, flavoprotein subunit [Aquifex aeolicus VF5]
MKSFTVDRRNLLLAGGIGLLGVYVSKSLVFGETKGNRVVVLGGGYGGVTTAKYVKKLYPDAEVVLVEKNPMFVSCPLSNLYLVGLVPYEQLCYPYNNLVTKYGVNFVNDEVIGIELDKREVILGNGRLKYDYLVISLGIEYDYEENPALKEVYWSYPPAFRQGSEHLYLKRMLEGFEGESILISVPKMPYRCPSAPYERAALILSYAKKEGLKVHLYFVDENERPPVLTKGFLKAYQDFYKDDATYLTSTKVLEVDPVKKVARTTKGDIKFSMANFIPPMRAPKLLEKAGLLKKGEKWVKVDPMTFETSVKNVFVIGDSAFTYLPKSGYAAHSQGKVVAKVIASRLRKKPWEGELIQQAVCYAMVNLKQAIMMNVEYKYNLKTKEIKKEIYEDDTWKVSTAKRYIEWARGLWRDMFT